MNKNTKLKRKFLKISNGTVKTLGLAFSLVVISNLNMSNSSLFVSNRSEITSHATVLDLRDSVIVRSEVFDLRSGFGYRLKTNDEGDNIATLIGSHFSNDRVVIPDKILARNNRIYTVKAIGHTAFARSAIRNVTIPDSVEVIEHGAFEGCKNLISVNFGANSRLNSIDVFAFWESGIRSITIPDSVEAIHQSAFFDCKNLMSVNFGENSRLNYIGRSAFTCSSILNITIPNSVETIGERAFAYCENLNSVNFGENSRLNLIEKHAFSNSSISDITIPDSVEEIGKKAFAECRNLNSINFRESSRINPVDFEKLGPIARKLPNVRA